jgi:Cytochrome P460
MPTNRLRHSVAVLCLGLIAPVVSCSVEDASPPTVLRPDVSVNAVVPGLKDYKAWTLVNPERVYLPPQMSVSCLAPDPKWNDRYVDPAAGSYISVYVNDAGRQAMMESRTPKFPIGSVIVKEKHPTKDDTAPELLTVMVKREKGFNPTSGDWEYLVTDGAAKQVQGRGKLANCMGCHEKRKDTDFVFRQYLPEKVSAGLK